MSFFFQELWHISLGSAGLLLVIQKTTSQQEWLRTRSVENFEDISLAAFYRREMGNSALGKKHNFSKHPVYRWISDIGNGFDGQMGWKDELICQDFSKGFWCGMIHQKSSFKIMLRLDILKGSTLTIFSSKVLNLYDLP